MGDVVGMGKRGEPHHPDMSGMEEILGIAAGSGARMGHHLIFSTCAIVSLLSWILPY